MKAGTLLFIILLSPAIVIAQYEFRPILDPSLLCNQSAGPKHHILNPLSDKNLEKYDVFYITEKMPEPKISADDIEELLGNKVRLPNPGKGKISTIHFQCLVNCKGEAGDFQVIYCPDELADAGDQVLKVFGESLKNWKPGMLRDKGVDVLVRITVSVFDGKFKVKAPVW